MDLISSLAVVILQWIKCHVIYCLHQSVLVTNVAKQNYCEIVLPVCTGTFLIYLGNSEVKSLVSSLSFIVYPC